MALLFMEGFEKYAPSTYTDLTQDPRVLGHPGTSTYIYPSNTVYRMNGQSLRLNTLSAYMNYAIPDSTDTYYVGFAYYTPDYAGAADILRARYDGTAQNNIQLNTDGTLDVTRNTTVLGTTTGTVVQNVWNYIVLKIKLSDTVGTVELWLNGVKELNLTSQDTLNAATAKINSVQWEGINNASYVDDIYVGDNSGTDMTDQVGDCHIEMLNPDANGNRNNFTASPAVSNYLNVDEGTPDDDTTYNYGSTVADAELYGTESMASADAVYAVQVSAVLRKEDAGFRTVNLICRSNTTESDSSAFGLSTDYFFYSDFFENDPNGGGNWTESAVNAMEIGFEIAS